MENQMTDKSNADEKTPTRRLVETPKGKGFFLTIQNVYVSSRPYVVENNSQVQIAANRNCLAILGTTTMTDEEFEKAYRKDPEAAVAKAVGKADDVDADAVKASAAKAKAAKAEAKEREAAEAKRLKDEEAAKVEAQKQHQAELAAKKAEKAED